MVGEVHIETTRTRGMRHAQLAGGKGKLRGVPPGHRGEQGLQVDGEGYCSHSKGDGQSPGALAPRVSAKGFIGGADGG